MWRNIVDTYTNSFWRDRRGRATLGFVLLFLAVVVAVLVYWQLRLSGIAMTNETYCGYEEHTHTEDCYESVLICGLEEIEGHVHDETCYDEEGNLVCETEECEPHTHGEECYETTLICELEEHVHTVDCLVDLEADIETAVDWEATLPVLTGDLRTDIVNIAYSQIGYTESTANYTLAEDGVTRLGYTRYGAWYGGLYFGSEYSDWDSMFVAFCLDYAGVAEELTYNSGAFAWSVELSELGFYQTADVYTPEVGDVAFIDNNADGRADVTAIVVAVDETITVIQGNVSDAVALVEYTIGETILGYANVTYTSEEETEDEEITLDESDEVIAEEIEELDVSAEDLSTLEFVGTDYIITVSYGEDAALPEGTELVAYEYAQDSENFLARYAEAALLYGWDSSESEETETEVVITEEAVTASVTGEVTGFASTEPVEEPVATDPYHGFRLFNIGLYYDGMEIEPAASVTVTVTYTGETDAASVSVTHFTDTTTETLDATLEQGTDSQSITFTADGFSEYGIMLTANATGPAIADVYGVQDLHVEIVNNIASTGKLEAKLYYLDSDDARVYVTDGSGNDYIESFTIDEVEYTVTYTWYRSKEPYLTDSGAPKTGYADTSTANYNYLLSTSSAFYAKVTDNYCSVVNGSYSYLFYYYYVGVSVTTEENNETVTKATYETDYNDIVYAFIDPTDTLNGAATYVVVTKDVTNNTLTATLYDSNGVYSNSDADAKYNENITYTYTWYKSRTYEATDDLTKISADDAPYANTIANTNDYVQVKTTTKTPNTTDTLTLTEKDSFYFYYLIVTLNYTPTNGTTSYAAYADGYDDYAYAGYVNTSGTYKAVIIDDLASSGTFKAVLCDKDGNIVTGTDYSWSKSDEEYEITAYYNSNTANTSIYSDQNVPADISYEAVTDSNVLSGNAINIAKDIGALHYYKVTITYGGVEYESAPKFVQYSDQIENGGFEIGSNTTTSGQTNELYVAYWHTTNGEYTENHGTYRGYPQIEIGHYAVVGDSSYGSTALGTYAIAYTKGGRAAQDFFVELNATEASTLYQSVITAPGNTYYWSVYHQNREYTNVTSTGETIDSGYLYKITYTGTDSMYVIIMSDADAEKLLAEVDNNSSYDSQQDVIDAVATDIIANGTKTTNGSVDVGDSDNPGSGTIDGSYSGEFTLSDGTKVDVTLWRVTTTKTVERVYLYKDRTVNSNNYADAKSLSSTYSEDAGWAALSGTVDGSTTTVGYYKVTDWVEYSGSYEVPDGQYLTRFFFAAASTQKNNNSAGNFIDGVSLTYAIDYTIEYWVWDYEKCEYVLQKDDTEEDRTVPYTTVDASKHDDYLQQGLGFVGSVTSFESGGPNPKSFDSTKNTSLYVDAYNYVLSLYYGGPGVIVEKEISGVSTAALSALDTTVNFTVIDKADNTNTATLNVNVVGVASGESSVKLEEGTYTITESDCSSLFDGKYVWVGVDITGATYNSSSGKYEFEITSTDPLPTVTYTNNYLPVVTLKKVESAYNTALSGVTFEMYKIENENKYYYVSCDEITHEIKWSDANESYSLTTDQDGTIAYSALPDGTYYLVETHAADGYNILTETLSFTVSGGTITEVKGDAISVDTTTDPYGLTIIVKNTPGVELPETGGVSLPVAYAVGSLMILASAIGLVVRKKKI